MGSDGVYFRLVVSRALKETIHFWNPQRVWVAVATPILAVPIQGFIKGWNMTDLLTTAGITAGVVAASWLLTFVFNCIRAPALLHDDLKERLRESESRRKAEEAKNDKPELKGEAFAFETASIPSENYFPSPTAELGPWSAHIQLRFKLNVCNHRPALTNVAAIMPDGSQLFILRSLHLIPARFSVRQWLMSALNRASTDKSLWYVTQSYTDCG